MIHIGCRKPRPLNSSFIRGRKLTESECTLASTMVLRTCLLLCSLWGSVTPHGYLFVPLQRSSMWRGGFNVPTNYDDNGLRCGGVMQPKNNGLCGICGDPWNATIKDNEPPLGKYATGIISKTYQEGERMAVEVKITSNHKGYFEFRLCPHNDVHTPATQACLDRYLLQVEEGGSVSTKYRLRPGNQIFKMNVLLPAGVTCSQCVFQWKYRAGNNWGCDGSDCGKGKGNQEHFINCADIAIIGRGQPQTQTPAPTSRPSPVPTTTQPLTAAPATAAPATAARTTISTATSATAGPSNTCPPVQCNCEATTSETASATSKAASATSTAASATSTAASATTTSTAASTTTSTAAPASAALSNTNYDNCRATGLFAQQSGITIWCKTNCRRGYCPKSHCDCGGPTPAPNYDNCRATGVWAQQSRITIWCKTNCRLGNCPKSYCDCGGPAPVPNYNRCRATGKYVGVPGMTAWCQRSCAHIPPDCPSTHCDCS